MLTAKLRTTAALLTVAAGLTFVANAGASTMRVGFVSTGDAGRDAFCRDATAGINAWLATSPDHEGLAGLLEQGRQIGCRFVVSLAPDGLVAPGAQRPTTVQLEPQSAADATVVVARPTGSIRLDARCREYAVQINQAYADGNPAYATSIRRGAEQKGCRFLVVHRVPTAMGDAGVLSARVG